MSLDYGSNFVFEALQVLLGAAPMAQRVRSAFDTHLRLMRPDDIHPDACEEVWTLRTQFEEYTRKPPRSEHAEHDEGARLARQLFVAYERLLLLVARDLDGT